MSCDIPQRPMAVHMPNSSDSYTSFASEADLEKQKGFGQVSIVSRGSFETIKDVSRPTSSVPSGLVHSEVDWDGPTDPGNPYNWSKGKKIFNMLVPSFMSLVTTLISSAYVAGIPLISQDLHVSFEVALVPYCAYILGLGIGAIFFGPCSEVFGRKMVYLVSIPLCGLFIVGTGLSNNITGLIFCRLLSGIFGIGPVSAAPGTIMDMFTREQAALPTALFVLTPFLGPGLAPVIASYVAPWKGWKWLCWVEVMILAVSWLPAVFLSETNKLIILQRRASKAGLSAPPSPVAGKSVGGVIMHYLNITLFLPLRMFYTESVVLCFSIYVAFNLALLYSFFAAFEYVWLSSYHFSEHHIGLTFLGIAIGCVVGLILLIVLAVVHTKPYFAKHAGEDIAPEFRLVPAMIGGCFLPCSLFLYAWASYYKVHWIVPVLAEAMFACGNFMVFMAVVVYFSDVYTRHGVVASALAANTLLRYILAAAFPLFSVQMFQKLGVQWAASLLGFLSIVLACMPFVFYRWGPALRKRSAYSSSMLQAEQE